ncbi:hypothetical protein CVT26_015651 [Gymnopilus dilepis]|uniref:Uncharacterized protein n=1 Tax=Gymnopilus dilepis TaxID=231916 RepID=A0A409VFB3_9AGAR|nr:hypothetical protein CVT26_015651 [Gymnopilus dilepis]
MSTQRSSMSSTGSKGSPSGGAIFNLTHSNNSFAAGIGEVIEAFVANASKSNTKPIMVEFGSRIMAVGRSRMAAMTGRNALLYMKSKFGLLNATTPLYLQAAFTGDEERFVEVDLDSWEELVEHMQKLRIIA